MSPESPESPEVSGVSGDRLTDDDLAAIQARADAATPGPWQYDPPNPFDGIPVKMVWTERPDRASRRCPRTFPHDPHGPWFDGVIRPAGEAVRFDCPGVPLGDSA